MPSLLSSRLRQSLAWLALCAMCFGAAAPTVSRWLAAAAQEVDLVAVCDGHGLEWVAVPEAQAQIQQTQQAQTHGHGQQQDQLPSSHHGSPGGDSSDGDCCPYCTLLHHWPCAPAAAVGFSPQVLLPVAHSVAADVPAPVLRAGHRPHLARAPPALA